MPVGNGPWQEIAMDFMVGLPDSDEFNAILVVVYPFSKMARYIPCRDTWISELLANAFIREIVRHFRPQKAITSDRDHKITSAMWTDNHKLLGASQPLTTLRQTTCRNAESKPSLSIYGSTPTTGSRNGASGFQWQSLNTITQSTAIGSHPSILCSVSTHR